MHHLFERELDLAHDLARLVEVAIPSEADHEQTRFAGGCEMHDLTGSLASRSSSAECLSNVWPRLSAMLCRMYFAVGAMLRGDVSTPWTVYVSCSRGLLSERRR